MNDNNSKSVSSHITRIKKFRNNILTKFNNTEWKQNQYYQHIFAFIKRHVLI